MSDFGVQQAVARNTPPIVQNIQLDFPNAVAVGSTIIVVIISTNPVTNIADTKGNGYAKDGEADAQGGHIAVYRAFVATGGSGYSIVVTTGVGPGAIGAVAMEVDALLIVDKTSAAAGSTTPPTSVARPGARQPFPIREFAVTAVHSYLGPALTLQNIVFNDSNWDSRYFLLNNSQGGIASGHILSRVYVFVDPEIPLDPNWNLLTSAPNFWLASLVMYFQKVTTTFTGTPTSGASPLSVAFTDGSTGDPTNWLWEFGDNQTSSEQNPTHIYAAQGTYSVKLTAWKAYGPQESLTRTNYIVVDGGGSGGGTPTGPIPQSYLTPPGFRFLPGSPAFSFFNSPRFPPPPTVATSAVTSGPGLLIPLTPIGEGRRQERASQALSLVTDSLIRQQMLVRDGQDEFGLVTGGFSADRPPTTTDDEAEGVPVGAVWVAVDSEGNYSIWICSDNTLDAAAWVEIGSGLLSELGGGLSGDFPS